MKELSLLLLFTLPTILFSQSDVPDKYWLDDSNYEKVINGKDAFGDDEVNIKVVEYWAKFNEKNCYSEWEDLIEKYGVEYYRVDISKAPQAKKKYRVRMAPTMFIIVDGTILTKFKAGLDLEFPASPQEVKESIKEAKNSNRY
tara:strand:- start:1352 stop:1780 length:429 start_codon:yes stop_codon:yes gene_type:complete